LLLRQIKKYIWTILQRLVREVVGRGRMVLHDNIMIQKMYHVLSTEYTFTKYWLEIVVMKNAYIYY
jgi:hypothetical protein